MGDFYETGIEILAGFGLIGSTEKRVWANYEQLLRVVFHVFMGNTRCHFLKKNIPPSTLKSCIDEVKKIFFFFKN